MRLVDETRLRLLFIQEELGMNTQELAKALQIDSKVIDAALGGDYSVLINIPSEALNVLYQQARSQAY